MKKKRKPESKAETPRVASLEQAQQFYGRSGFAGAADKLGIKPHAFDGCRMLYLVDDLARANDFLRANPSFRYRS